MKGPGWTGKINHYPYRDRWKTWWPSELERREAARFVHMEWEHFQSLPGTREVAEQLEIDNSKCSVIAQYRMVLLNDAVLADLRRKYPEKTKPHGT